MKQHFCVGQNINPNCALGRKVYVPKSKKYSSRKKKIRNPTGVMEFVLVHSSHYKKSWAGSDIRIVSCGCKYIHVGWSASPPKKISTSHTDTLFIWITYPPDSIYLSIRLESTETLILR